MSAPTNMDLVFATLLVCILLSGIFTAAILAASELEKIRKHLEGGAKIKEGK